MSIHTSSESRCGSMQRPNQLRPMALACGSLSLGLALLNGCGSEEPDSGQESRPPLTVLAADDTEPKLTCPDSDRVSSSDSIAEDARGAASAEAAVSEYADNRAAVINNDNTEAWILRADGSAEESLGLLNNGDWFITEVESC